MVMLGVGLPALPRKLVDKIEAGEYIDLTELPPARGNSQSILPAVEGQVLVVQAVDLLQSCRVIPDLATWLQCFAIYAAVIAAKQPSCLPDLLAYMSIIAKASSYGHPGWYTTKTSVRKLPAAETTSGLGSTQESMLNVSQTWQLGQKGGTSTANQYSTPLNAVR